MIVEEFLKSKGFSPLTGYIGESQEKQFSERLSMLPNIRTIAEIGFNAGHSAECFFTHCKNLEGFLSFDINVFPYTKIAAEYFEKLFPNRFLFIEGHSLITVPEFARSFPKQKFDLIYIDGSHAFETVVGDIHHAKELAHPETLLWMDDYHFPHVWKAIQFCLTIGLIQMNEVFSPKDANDLERTWVEIKYA